MSADAASAESPRRVGDGAGLAWARRGGLAFIS